MKPDGIKSKFFSSPSDQPNPENPGPNASGRSVRKPAAAFPQRYAIRGINGEKMLSCVEAPNLNVQIKFGLSVSAAAVGKAPAGTIYLDGVAQTGPLLDNARQVYNFDHHEGCVRAFTLSTCEQVLVMLKKGFDLKSREWKIIANDPDLDTVLAIWLLLNHVRISEKESVREHILFPLIRLEGAIDSLGLELKSLTALSPAQMNQSQRIIDHLRRVELRLKKDGHWGEETDFIAYAADLLHDIDQIMYEPEKFGQLLGIEELARVNLPDGHQAVVVQSDMGIYEIEPLLKKIYGDSIGLAILRRSPTAYTLRLMNPFLSTSLEDVYATLNFLDPAVKGRAQDRWGGSSDIGGSPRERGTQLTPEQIAAACREAFQKYDLIQRLVQFFLSAVVAGAVLGISAVFAVRWLPAKDFSAPWLAALLSDPYLKFSMAVIFLTTLFLVGAARRGPWQFGMIAPMGKSWWIVLPIAIIGALAGGAWQPIQAHSHPVPDIGRRILNACFLSFAAEYLFRGLIHGILAKKSKIQSHESRLFISWPNAGAGILYALSFPLLPVFHPETFNPFSITWELGGMVFAAFCFSLFLGGVRERSHSVFSAFLIHLLAVLSVLFLPELLGFL